jgi:hypothetical protein
LSLCILVSSNTMYIRILTVISLTIGAFIAPWWSVALGLAICAVVYRNFLEGLIPAIIIDVLYGAHPILGIPGLFTAATALLIVISLFSEGYIRGHVRI